MLSTRITMNLLLLACAVSLAGCASPVTRADLESTGSKFEELVPFTPATAFRQLTERTRECWYGPSVRVDADFFPDNNTGHVSIIAAPISLTFATAKLQPAANGMTLVTVSYYTPPSSASRGDEWRRSLIPWAKGELGVCVTDATRPPPMPTWQK